MNEYVARAIRSSEKSVGLQVSMLKSQIDHLKNSLAEAEKEHVELVKAHEALLDALREKESSVRLAKPLGEAA